MKDYFAQIPFASGAATQYFIAPFRCTLNDVSGVVQADPGDAETVTFKDGAGGNSLGVLTFGTDIAAGAKGTYVPDTTYGSTVLEEGDLIEIVTSTAADAVCDMFLKLDENAMTVRDFDV